jgi:hypothetical protein
MQTNKTIRWAKRNPVEAAGLVAFVILFLCYSPALLRSLQAQDRLRQFAAQQQEAVQQSQLLGDEAQERAKIAVARYKNGAKFVVATANPNQAVAIAEGQPVLDATTKLPLPNKTIVADTLGNTGVIINGVVADVAFTGDASIVQEAIKASNFNRAAKTPTLGGQSK